MRRAALVVTALLFSAAACAGPPPVVPKKPTPAPQPVSDDHSGFEGKGFSSYRSDRLGLSLPLPEMPTWILADRDDKEGGWLVASHPRTSTTVRVRKFDETGLVGRMECEKRARLMGELPAEGDPKRTLEPIVDEAARIPKGWDGRKLVAFERIGGRLLGHVWVVSGRGHTCFVAHATTEARSDAETMELSDRLELLDSRVVGAITVDRAEGPELVKPAVP